MSCKLSYAVFCNANDQHSPTDKYPDKTDVKKPILLKSFLFLDKKRDFYNSNIRIIFLTTKLS